ncbi:hypothetical protein ABG461_004201 [Escherichia coli]
MGNNSPFLSIIGNKQKQEIHKKQKDDTHQTTNKTYKISKKEYQQTYNGIDNDHGNKLKTQNIAYR